MKTESEVRSRIIKIEKDLEKFKIKRKELCDECELNDYSFEKFDIDININKAVLKNLKWVLSERS